MVTNHESLNVYPLLNFNIVTNWKIAGGQSSIRVIEAYNKNLDKNVM